MERYNAATMGAPPVRYVRTSDGYDIAYKVYGAGRAFVYVPLRFNNIGENPATDRFFTVIAHLASSFRLVRYDSRGQGMSTRGLPEDFTALDYERDLETVVEHLKLKDFVLAAYGVCGHAAVRYAVRHPESVYALILWNCSVQFSDVYPPGLDWTIHLNQVVAPSTRDAAEQQEQVERLRQTTTQRDHMISTKAWTASRIEGELPRLRVPTLVLEMAGAVPAILGPEESMRLAASIAGARLVRVERPARDLSVKPALVDAIEAFVRSIEEGEGPSLAGLPAGLSDRELEVLRLLAAGRTNQQIAEALVISPNTVAKHVSSILTKLGVANRVEAATYAQRSGFLTPTK